MDSRVLPAGKLEENGDAAALPEIELFPLPVCGNTYLLNQNFLSAQSYFITKMYFSFFSREFRVMAGGAIAAAPPGLCGQRGEARCDCSAFSQKAKERSQVQYLKTSDAMQLQRIKLEEK